MRDEGRCIVFCSHVLEEVRALFDRVVILSRGTIIAEGSIGEICAKTNTDNFEEAFVATMSRAGGSSMSNVPPRYFEMSITH
jgi:sodium transport system ATP-binding protein